ncbi:restriction endonuclease subunit S [uncultured Paraglaciecola sp.]|uniref:restriction endonuclease subunit S n=1 Tax=uncultured Paraglaciecola sp. TaxID=1765024 RepID=UPI0030DA6131|tara:strand:- start:10369 stop:11697 length:1329 start_codon:yes stop_codon:yes gene_type:complete
MDAIIDYRGKTPKKTDSGIPLITAKIIKNGRIQDVNEFIAEGDYDSWMRRGIPKAGDIVLTTEAPLGEVAQLDDRKIALAQRVITLRGKKGLLNNDYLKYLLQSNDTQHQLDGRGTGTTVKGIKQSELREVILNFPDLPVQESVAFMLKTLDGKIENNRKTNQTLEKMAQTLFKSWFVDFDPVIDNALAAGNEIPDALQHRVEIRKKAHALQKQNPNIQPLPEATQRLFPSELEHTDEASIGINGWVPKGWQTKSVDECININPRVSLPKGTLAKFADMKALPTSGYGIMDVIEKNYTGGAKFQQGDVLLARITPCLQNGKTGIVDFMDEDNEIGFGSTEFIVMRRKGGLGTPFISCLARDENFRNHCMQSMVGSSGRQRVQNACFSAYFLALPTTENVLNTFQTIVAPMFTRMTINNEETKSLANLRDLLLPKLISGEITT